MLAIALTNADARREVNLVVIRWLRSLELTVLNPLYERGIREVELSIKLTRSLRDSRIKTLEIVRAPDDQDPVVLL